jgi:hypothetical protein
VIVGVRELSVRCLPGGCWLLTTHGAAAAMGARLPQLFPRRKRRMKRPLPRAASGKARYVDRGAPILNEWWAVGIASPTADV